MERLKELLSKEFTMGCIEKAFEDVENYYGIKRDKFKEEHVKEVYEYSLELHYMCLNAEGYYEISPNKWIKLKEVD